MTIKFAEVLSFEIESIVEDMTQSGAEVEATSFTMDYGELVVFAIVYDADTFMSAFSETNSYSKMQAWQ